VKRKLVHMWAQSKLLVLSLLKVEWIYGGTKLVWGMPVSKGNLCLPFPHINHLNTELNPICYLPTLLGAHHILHVSWIRVKECFCTCTINQPMHSYEYVQSHTDVLQQLVSVTPVTVISGPYTRVVRRAIFEYRENRSHGLDVPWQPVRRP